MKHKPYIRNCIREISTLPKASEAGFNIDRLRRVHALGLVRHSRQPLGRALYTLHALGVEIVDLPYVAGLIKTFLFRRREIESGLIFDHLYLNFSIPKRNGTSRVISAPTQRLKRVQKALLPALSYAYEDEPTPYGAHGFRKGYSNITAASCHIGADCVVKMDIKDFFPSIRTDLVKSALDRAANTLEIDLGWLVKYFLLEILTHNGALPTGAPTSPVISNILLKYFDRRLEYLSVRNGLSYSRFADDITVSGPSGTAVKLIRSVKEELEIRGGFELNEDKLNIQRKGRRQTVCGVVVNDKLSLGREHRRKLRAAKHRASMGLIPHLNGAPLSTSQLQGHLAYLQAVYDKPANGG